MIEAIKELNGDLKVLKDENSELTAQLNSCCNNTFKNLTSDNISSSIVKPVLYQNIPNPFSDNTEISFVIPESTINAMLYIFDMNGKQIKSFQINERNSSNLIINGNELEAGMYLYTLIGGCP